MYQVVQVGEETWKKGVRMWWGGGGDYEGVDEGEMQGLHSLLNTVGFVFLFPFPSPLCALHEADKPDQREGGGEGEGDADEGLCGPGAWSAPVAGPWRAART